MCVYVNAYIGRRAAHTGVTEAKSMLRAPAASKNPRTKNLRVEISGKFPMCLGIPPLQVENLASSRSPEVPDS